MVSISHDSAHAMMGSDWDCGNNFCEYRKGSKENDWAGQQGYSENKSGSEENRVRKQGSKELSLYIDGNDWWVGYYRGDEHHYVCLLPCIVIRWNRFRDDR